MLLLENVLLRPKTTMRIGGTARYFAEVRSQQECEEIVVFAEKNQLPLILLGSGSNTIFADGVIQAVVVQVKHDQVTVEGNTVRVGAGKNLPMLISDLAALGLDLSALTGIPGTLGGAIFGNAGQGPQGTWIDAFVHTVTAYIDGEWRTLTKSECSFEYRESRFKREKAPVIIFELVLNVPSGEPATIQRSIEELLQKRIETQPHLKTAGSCFKAHGGIPAWKLIDSAGLRGHIQGGIQIAEKHANFLLNVGQGSYADAVKLIETVQGKIPENLDVEMRFIESDGSLRF